MGKAQDVDKNAKFALYYTSDCAINNNNNNDNNLLNVQYMLACLLCI